MINMSNIEVLESATLISNDLSDPRRDSMVKLLGKYYKREASIDELRELLTSDMYHKFIEELHGKSVYDSIVQLYNSKVNNHRAAILTSSLLTHASIQMEQDKELTPSQVRYSDLLDVLSSYAVDGVVDLRKLRQIITSLGFIYKSK